MQKIPNLILVDDHLLFRQSIKYILTNENIACVIGEANNGIEFLELLLQLTPDLVLMDINMPQMNGIEATQKAIERYPDLKIIVYTMFGEADYYQKMIALGVKGFIIKSGSITDLEKAIDEVMKGNIYFSLTFQDKSTNNFDCNIIIDPFVRKGYTSGKYVKNKKYLKNN